MTAKLITASGVTGSTPTYTLTVDNTSGIVAQDYYSDNAGHIYRISAISDGTHLTVVDDVSPDAPEGTPSIGSGSVFTPTTNVKLSQPPFNTPGWGEILRRDQRRLDSFIGANALVNLSTQAAITLYVATTGDDLNPGTSNLPFRTLQAAINSLPKRLRHPVKINLGSGSFDGVDISGFTFELASNKDLGSYLTIEGTFVPATPTTGTNTGVATGGTAGSGITYGTLVDNLQTWTVDNFKGKYINRISGTGALTRTLILGNTTTTITVLGTWTAPATDSVYLIEDLATSMVTATDLEVRLSTGSSTTEVSTRSPAGGAVVQVSGNVANHLPGISDVSIRGINFANPIGNSVQGTGNVRISCVWCRFTTTSGNLSPRYTLNSGAGGTISHTWFNNDSTNILGMIIVNNPPSSTFALNNSLITGTNGRLMNGQGQWSMSSVYSSLGGRSGAEVSSCWSAATISNSIFITLGSTAFQYGSTSAGNNTQGTHSLSFSTCSIMTTGGVAISMSGGTFRLNVVNTSGSGNSVGIQVWSGAVAQVDASTTLSGTLGDLEIAGAFYSLAQLRALTPIIIKDANDNSTVYQGS